MASDEPPQIYYPSARVRLSVRFEEFEATDTPTPPTKPPQLRAGKGEPQLDIVVKNGILLLQPFGGGDDIGPGAVQTTSKDARTFDIDGIVPNQASLSRNGVRTADTLELTIPFSNLPFDPQVMRAIGVEFYLGTVTEEDYQRGINGELGANGFPRNMIPDTYTDARGRMRSNMRFQGWVDEWENSFDADGEPVVNLQCTDYTRVLIDQLAPPKLVIGADVQLSQAIAEYLANFPQFRGVGVQYLPVGAEQPMLKDVFAKGAFGKLTLGPSPQGNDKLNAWDYVTDVTRATGHICHVENTVLDDGSNVPTIVIQRPRTLVAGKFSGREDDPFTGRILPSGRELLARTFVYGKNVTAFGVSRKFAKLAPTAIEVRCFSSKVKKTLVARFPIEKDKRDKKLAPGDQAEQKWDVVTVDGIDDEATLRAIAQGVYESQGRGELVGTISTKNMASFGGGNPDPDILDIQAGDQIELEMHKDLDAPNTVVSIQDAQGARAAEFLIQKGFSKEIADAYGKAKANIFFPTSYRVREMGIDWDVSEGVSIDIEATNYASAARDTLKLPDGEEHEPSAASKGAPERVEV